ncbi:MAG: hypothetical protein AB7R89_26495 [Dehalococcoidia bacterium]
MPRERAHENEERTDQDAEAPPRLGPLTTSPEDELGKEELNITAEALSAGSSDRVAVVMRVSEESYVPAGVAVRARISPTIFTAELTREEIDRLQRDPKLVSIGTARDVRPAQE